VVRRPVLLFHFSESQLVKRLKPYHNSALQYLRSHRYGAIFMEMRLRKTLLMIRFIKQYPNIKSILIVAPYSALVGWEDLLVEEKEPITILNGSRDDRLECLLDLDSRKKWFLINKEGFLCVPEIKDIAWDCVILDESTFIKNPKPKVTKYFTKNFNDVPYRYILTGTPAPESELDYFCQLQFLDPTILDCKHYYEFRHKYFRPYGFKWKIKPAAKAVLSQRIGGACFFLKREDVGIAGEKEIITRKVQMCDELKKKYDEFEEFFWTEINGTVLKTAFAGAKFCKLRQICSGIINAENIYTHKIDEIITLLKGELKDAPVIVWAWFRNEIDYLSKALHCDAIHHEIKPKRRAEINKAFQNGEVQYVVAQHDVWRFGTTLSHASTAINFSLPLSELTRAQVNDRTVDVDKKEPSLIIDLITEGTVEEDILEGLNAKEEEDKIFRRCMRRFQKYHNGRSGNQFGNSILGKQKGN
jgi:hypothetical protein